MHAVSGTAFPAGFMLCPAPLHRFAGCFYMAA
nr:MAG TPA: hypothetical protein [Caudoviricetes sp.]